MISYARVSEFYVTTAGHPNAISSVVDIVGNGRVLYMYTILLSFPRCMDRKELRCYHLHSKSTDSLARMKELP